MIPTQERADMNDPEQFAAWVFIALQMQSGDTLNFHPLDAAAASKQLWEAGFRHHPELQSHRMSIPGGPDQSFLAASGGDWVAASTAESEIETGRRQVPDISGLSLEQRMALLDQLHALGHGGPVASPLPEGAEVSEAVPFTPSGPIVGEAE